MKFWIYVKQRFTPIYNLENIFLFLGRSQPKSKYWLPLFSIFSQCLFVKYIFQKNWNKSFEGSKCMKQIKSENMHAYLIRFCLVGGAEAIYSSFYTPFWRWACSLWANKNSRCSIGIVRDHIREKFTYESVNERSPPTILSPGGWGCRI